MPCNINCNLNSSCFIGILLSLFLGAAVGILFAFGFIPGIVISAWIAFGLGVLTLIFLVYGLFLAAVSPTGPLSKCLYKNTLCLLIGIFGTIITALAALSIVLTPIFISVIILVAIGGFFFSLMIFSLIALLCCITCELYSFCQKNY